ncbi:hypothetical protein JOM56_009332 [Amanita muscaria]
MHHFFACLPTNYENKVHSVVTEPAQVASRIGVSQSVLGDALRVRLELILDYEIVLVEATTRKEEGSVGITVWASYAFGSIDAESLHGPLHQCDRADGGVVDVGRPLEVVLGMSKKSHYIYKYYLDAPQRMGTSLGGVNQGHTDNANSRGSTSILAPATPSPKKKRKLETAKDVSKHTERAMLHLLRLQGTGDKPAPATFLKQGRSLDE